MAVLINEVIFRNMPILVAGTDDLKVEGAKNEAFVMLKKFLNRNTLAEVESSGTEEENLLVAYYSLYLLSQTQLNPNLSTAQGEGYGRAERRIKADVTEIEYENDKNAISPEQTIAMYKKKVCELAINLGYTLPLCAVDTPIVSYSSMIKVFPMNN